MLFSIFSPRNSVAKGVLFLKQKMKDKSKNIPKNIPTTYLGVLRAYEDEMLSPTYRYHNAWGSGHILGMKTSSMYFRCNTKAIKCDC